MGAAFLHESPEAVEAIQTALELGVNYFDTYPGHHEEKWGDALSGVPRSSYYLQAKIGTHPERRKDFSGEGARWSLDQSLRSLKTDYLDCVLVHDPADVEELLREGAVFDVLLEMKSQGVVRNIGLGARSHDWHVRLIDEGISDVSLTFLDYTLVNQTAAATIFPAARRRSTGVILASVQGMGLLTGQEPDPDRERGMHPGSEPRAHRIWTWCREHGVNIRHLGKRGLAQFRIPVAPLAEQERIVAAIEEHFSRLDAATVALADAHKKLDVLLRAVLRTVCEGSWDTKPLGQVIVSLKNGVFVSRPSATPPGHPIYRISAVRPLVLRIDDIRWANPVPDSFHNYAVEAGDILFTRYSGNPTYVGAAAVVPQDGAGVLHPDKLIRVIADRDSVLPEWIAAYVTAGQGRREIEKRLKTTAGQVGISGSQLRSVPIAVPPIAYQQHAVNKISNVLAERERIHQTLSATRERIEVLRQSVLALAFSGRLVPQDPNDELATTLLERIAISRRTAPTRQD